MIEKKKKATNFNLVTYCIVIVWFLNGFFCKVLNQVPRHEQIVARILGNGYSREFTIFIGISEICMAIWIVSGYKTKLNTWVQILVVLTMNILEFLLVPDLLLWGKLNFLFAFLSVLVIYFNQLYSNKNSTQIK